MALSLASDHLDLLGMVPGRTILTHIPTARVGFSPYLKHIVGWGWPSGSPETLEVYQFCRTSICELDYIPTYLLKEHLDIFLPVLQCIINTSLQQGMFPHCLRTALVRPLLKKAGLDLVEKNFRPVSNLAYLGNSLSVQLVTKLLDIPL